MNTCESCISREQVTDCDVACSRGISQRGRFPVSGLGCTLWEAKPIEFEAEIKVCYFPGGSQEGFAGIPLPRCDLATVGRKYKVTLEPIE